MAKCGSGSGRRVTGVVHCVQACSDFPAPHQVPPNVQYWLRGPGRDEYQRKHLLAGVWHLATHSPEILEAVSDGMDVGHSHKHHFTVRIVLCRQERKVGHTLKQPLRKEQPQ